MKTLPVIAFLAALVAFLVLPINFVTAVSVLFGAGLAAILVSDYTRGPRLARARPAPALAAPPQRTERFGLAA